MLQSTTQPYLDCTPVICRPRIEKTFTEYCSAVEPCYKFRPSKRIVYLGSIGMYLRLLGK